MHKVSDVKVQLRGNLVVLKDLKEYTVFEGRCKVLILSNSKGCLFGAKVDRLILLNGSEADYEYCLTDTGNILVDQLSTARGHF